MVVEEGNTDKLDHWTNKTTGLIRQTIPLDKLDKLYHWTNKVFFEGAPPVNG